MHLESHAGLGWAIGVLAPGSERRLRNWCLAASVAPDVDALSYVFGDVAYSRWHHTFGHNVFFGAALAAAAFGRRKRALAAGLVALSFGLHLLADAKLSGYAVPFLWPLDKTAHEFSPNYGIGAPINVLLVWASLAAAALLAVLKRVTPVDVFSPALDRLLVSPFLPRRLRCCRCSRPCNLRCGACREPVCIRHTKLGRAFHVRCGACPEPSPPP